MTKLFAVSAGHVIFWPPNIKPKYYWTLPRAKPAFLRSISTAYSAPRWRNAA